MKKKSILFLFLIAISLFSCSGKTGIYSGQKTRNAFDMIDRLNITFFNEKDFTLFQYDNRNYVMQLDYDYQHIKKIKDFEPVVPSLSDFDKLESNMDLFQIVELYGLPCISAQNYMNTSYGFDSKEGVVKLVFFHSDKSHIYKTY